MVVDIDCLCRCGEIFLRLAEPLIAAVERQKDIEGSLLREAAVNLLKAFQLLEDFCGLLKEDLNLCLRQTLHKIHAHAENRTDTIPIRADVSADADSLRAFTFFYQI